MDETTATTPTQETAAPQPDKPKRETGTISFPYSDLGDASALAQAIWEHVGTSTCDQAQLAAWAGHDSVDSGTFRTRMSAARGFGLITSGSKQVALTDLGRSIVDPERSAQARVDAFLFVPLYRRMFERYEGTTLPTTNIALEADLVDLGVAEKQKDRARQVFQRSAEQAGFFGQGRNRLVRPAFRQDAPPPRQEELGGGGGGGGSGRDIDTLDPFIRGLVESLPEKGSVFSVGRRKKWLQTAEGIFSLMYEEEAEVSPSVSRASAPQPPDERSLASSQD